MIIFNLNLILTAVSYNTLWNSLKENVHKKDHSYLPCCSNIKTTALMKNERKISIMLLSQNVMHSALLVKSIYRISIQKQSEKHCGEREQAEETFRNSCHPPDISRLPHPPPPRSSLHHPAKLFFIGAGVLQNSLCVCDREWGGDKELVLLVNRCSNCWNHATADFSVVWHQYEIIKRS